MRDSHQVDQLLDRTAEQIRRAVPDATAVENAAREVRALLAAEDPSAATAAAEVRRIEGCDDYQALIPAYLRGELPEARRLLLEDHSRECLPCRRALKAARAGETLAPAAAPAQSRAMSPFVRWAAAAAMVAGLGFALFLATQLLPFGKTPRAVVRSAEGGLFRVTSASYTPVSTGMEIHRGEVVRTGRRGGAVLELADGSQIEMRARSELFLRRARRGTTVDLSRGSIIVQAAEQREGRLFVATEDCLVSVKGTIFSVNHGVKGSRVAVIEGEVRVDHEGDENLLLAGDQLATHASLTTRSVASSVEWSRDVDRYLALLAEVEDLRRELSTSMLLPERRYSSRLLDLMPEDTVLYAALPNLGPSLGDGRRIIAEHLSNSPVLGDWWRQHQDQELETLLDQIFARIEALSSFLGQEVAVGGRLGSDDLEALLVLAELVDEAGLRSFIDEEIPDDVQRLQIIEDPYAPIAAGNDKIFLWLHEDLAVATPRPAELRQVADIVLRGQPSPFAASDFRADILDLYTEGVEVLAAADLETILPMASGEDPRDVATLESFGVLDLEHAFLELQIGAGRNDQRFGLTFAEARSGIASWLAEPAPMGSLDFISPEAKLATALVFKDPAAMLDDIETMIPKDAAGSFLQALNDGLGLDLRDDLAATLGGELAFAIDGPLFPKPSWKLILEIYDSARFQWSLEQSLERLGAMVSGPDIPRGEIESTQIGGRTFYTLRNTNGAGEVHYTFVEGYLVAAPNRALLDLAIRSQDSGFHLRNSPRFSALLPVDGRNDFSFLLYRNVAGMLDAFSGYLGNLNEAQRQKLEDLEKGMEPSLSCIYAEPEKITAILVDHDLIADGLLGLLGIQSSFDLFGMLSPDQPEPAMGDEPPQTPGNTA